MRQDEAELSPTAWRPVDEPVRFQVSRGVAELFHRHGFGDVAAVLNELADVGELTVCVERDVTRDGAVEVEVAGCATTRE